MVLLSLIKRNVKIYFKDKSVFLPSLITPFILLLLYVTFLKNVYVDSFNTSIPEGITLEERVINGFVGGWLISSLLAVCCVTVAFCVSTIMVSDKVSGAYNDMSITPVKKSILGLSYYLSTALITFIISLVAIVGGLMYLGIVGWYLSVVDIILLFVDVILLVLFGSGLAIIIANFIHSVGGVSAVSTIVSSAYGFICGAYMPMSQFGDTLRNILMLLPGTYGTGLIRSHLLRGVMEQINASSVPSELVNEISKVFDIKLFLFGNEVKPITMYLVLGLSVVIVTTIVILLTIGLFKKKSKAQSNKVLIKK